MFTKQVMTIEAIKSDLLKEIEENLPVDKDTNLYVKGLCIKKVEEILSSLSNTKVSLEEYNGSDMDWSYDDIVINNKVYSVWGSGYWGNLCFSMVK